MKLRVLILLTCLSLIQAKLWDLSCDQIRAFVDGHNRRRLDLAKGAVPGQPAAAQMELMVWDTELAEKAAKWAKNDLYQHNPDKTIPSERFSCGENIYRYSTTDQDYKFDPDMALEEWFIEHHDFQHHSLLGSDFGGGGPMIGHYTQMAWAKTTHVGCAISQYHDKKKWNSFLVVCNYGPTGNYIDQEPYKTGKASGKLSCHGTHCNNQYGNQC